MIKKNTKQAILLKIQVKVDFLVFTVKMPSNLLKLFPCLQRNYYLPITYPTQVILFFVILVNESNFSCPKSPSS